MIVIGGIGSMISIVSIISLISIFLRGLWGIESGWALVGAVFVGVTTFLPSLFFLLPGFFLLKRKKWAWQFSIVILILLIILFCFSRFPFFPKVGVSPRSYLLWVLLFVLPPLILLLLDRKNFLKITS
jgi:hypothetical protein